MRLLALATLAILCGCSDFFTPPCTRVSKAVCDVGGQGDACAFLLNLPRNDARAQGVCKQVLPQAQALQQSPNDETARAGWQAARASLYALGLVTDDRKNRIGEKLKEAGGEAGHLVQKAEDAAALGEQKTTDGANQALEGENH